jgi:O-antigen ligase
LRRIVFLCFAATVALVPLPLGSNRDWSWSPLEIVIGTLLLAWAITIFVQPEAQGRPVVSFKTLRVPLVLAGLVVVWGVAQMSGWMPAGWASPLSASAAFDLPSTSHSVTSDSEQSLTGLMRLLTYVGVFILAASLSSNPSDARRILGVVVFSAVLYTLYAMAADVINRQTRATGISLWVPHEEFFTGTFINSNNYATYAGVAALTAFVLAAGPRRSNDDRGSARQRWRRRIGELSGRSGLWVAAALILVVGVLLSGSRAGWISLAIAVMAMAALYMRGAGRVAFTLLAPLVFLALAVLLPGGDKLVTKTARLIAEGETGRETLFPLTLNAIGLRPVVGWGMNSFERLYSVFQPITLPEFYDKAHNTCLELAFDLGIPAAAMLVLAVIWIVVRCLVGFFTRRRDRELAGLGFLAAVLVGVHSLFDFSMQIPGMACVFFAILGVSWSQAWSSQHSQT